MTVLKENAMNWTNISILVLGLLAKLTISTAQAAPITFNTALPVSKGEFLVRQQFVVMQSGDDPSRSNRDRTETASVTTLVYGTDKNLSVFGVLPYRDIKLEVNMAGQHFTRENSGLGDISLFGRYIFQQNNQAGRSFRLAAFGGAKIPTGDDETRDNLGKLPAPVQTGSGSWDLFGGIVATQQTLDYQIDGHLSYRINNKANNFDAGDVIRADGSYQIRIWPSKLGSGVPGFLYAVIEANLVSQSKNKVNGNYDANSGGTRLLISPGIQYVTRRWIAEGGIQIPALQDLNGTALELDFIARAGLRFNF